MMVDMLLHNYLELTGTYDIFLSGGIKNDIYIGIIYNKYNKL
jgi:hypothetical protein